MQGRRVRAPRPSIRFRAGAEDASRRRCEFFDQASTLGEGYCDGGNCYVNGRLWPAKIANVLSF